MDKLPMHSGVGPTHAFIFAVSIVLMLFGWRWGEQVAGYSAQRGYWIGLASSALPAASAWWSSMALRRRRGAGRASGAEEAFDVLRWLSLAFLALMAFLLA